MAEEKILVTDLIKEVGTHALSSIHREPFIKWVLEKTGIVVENEISAIILPDAGKADCFLWFGQPLNEECTREFKLKALEALNSALASGVPEGAVNVIAFNEGEVPVKKLVAGAHIESFYCSALIVRDAFIGVFAVASTKPSAFLAYKVNMFNVFTSQVALAIDSLTAREQVVKQSRIIERDSANMKLAFSGMSDGLVMVDENDNIMLVNPAARRMLGQNGHSGQIPKESFETLFKPVLRELADTGKQLISKEVELSAAKAVTLRIDAVPASDSKGARFGTVILIRDVTREREIDRLKNEFVSTVSHELRTPLTTIRESVSQVLDEILGPTTAEQREFLSMCLEDIDRLTRIINELLDISKIEARKVQLKLEQVDMVSLARNIGVFFSSRMKEKGLELRTSFGSERIEALADKDKMIQVFTNLVGNSLKFTDKGYIEISVRESGAAVECSVFDTGRGIAEDDLPKVFSKFQQFGRVEGPGEKGTGLGLSIAKGIVELHQGVIRVQSRLNHGTMFTFSFPKSQPEKKA